MKASEARDITARATTTNTQIEEFYQGVIADIASAAQEGRSETRLTLPIECRIHQRDLVIQRLRADGYTISNNPDPDPGHPASGSYTTIEW